MCSRKRSWNVVDAAVAGFNVAVWPDHAARALLVTGRLVPVLPDVEVTPEHFQLIYRHDRQVEAEVVQIAAALKIQRP